MFYFDNWLFQIEMSAWKLVEAVEEVRPNDVSAGFVDRRGGRGGGRGKGMFVVLLWVFLRILLGMFCCIVRSHLFCKQRDAWIIIILTTSATVSPTATLKLLCFLEMITRNLPCQTLCCLTVFPRCSHYYLYFFSLLIFLPPLRVLLSSCALFITMQSFFFSCYLSNSPP